MSEMGAASRAPSAEPAGQQNSQGNQKHALPGQGNGKGGYRPADPLKERGGGQMQAVQEEGGHIQPEAVLGTVQVEGLSETNSIPICRGNSWNTRNHTPEITRAMAAAVRKVCRTRRKCFAPKL